MSYRANDVGRPGVPRLTDDQRGVLAKIRRYLHSETLRFAFVGGSMIVFDARSGPCWDAAPGYKVLNGACNEYYEPGEDPTSTFGIPHCYETLPPWKT